MSGIYLHIPFCKQACHYCNFHFSTSLKLKNELLAALLQEIYLQKDYLKGETIETVYIGGGTPSLLTAQEINQLFETLHQHFDIKSDAECTLEANPDDLTPQSLHKFHQTPINRFSIGIQSFLAADLTYMNRAHNVQQALQCVPMTQDAGFENISIDLIYGTPTLNNESWIKNMETAFEWKVPHISAYGLTVEENTALAHLIEKKKVLAPTDEKAQEQMLILMEKMAENGYEHYEVSNFSKPNHRSKHNTSYWLGKKYVGLGPAAHSYNQISRQWNIAHNVKYIKSIKDNILPAEIEILTEVQKFNEYLMVSLRTSWGADLNKIKNDFPSSYFQHLSREIQVFLSTQKAFIENDQLRLTPTGILIADYLTAQLFVEEIA